MMNYDSSLYSSSAYIMRCMECTGDDDDAVLKEKNFDQNRFACSFCEKRERKGVLLNSKRTFLNNVG